MLALIEREILKKCCDFGDSNLFKIDFVSPFDLITFSVLKIVHRTTLGIIMERL